MNNLKISSRLMILIGILSALLVAIGSIGLFGISQSNAALKTVYEDRTVAVGQIADITGLILRSQLALASSLITPVPEEIARNIAEVETNMATIEKVWELYMATTITTEEAAIAKKFAEGRAKFVEEGLKPAVAALRANDLEDARDIVRSKVRPLYASVIESIAALAKIQLDEAKAEYDAAVARYQTIRTIAISAIVAGVLFAVIFGLALVRGISRSLNQAIDTANAVTQGDLSRPVLVEGKDEVSLLLASLATMQASLASIVG